MTPSFSDEEKQSLATLLSWRRDVRHFKAGAVDDGLLKRLLEKANHAPSVGLSQPWRFVVVQNQEMRGQVAANFEKCRVEAEAGIDGPKLGQYGRAKLEGLKEAPVHLAVFTDMATFRGHGLGRYTMPESLEYSTVMAIHTLWLAARMEGLGVGWISILEPEAIRKILGVAAEWKLTAYLCLGHPAAESTQPELESVGWEKRREAQDLVYWKS